jgi:hypothetical protein
MLFSPSVSLSKGNMVERFFIFGGAPLAHEDLVCNGTEQKNLEA